MHCPKCGGTLNLEDYQMERDGHYIVLQLECTVCGMTFDLTLPIDVLVEVLMAKWEISTE